MTGQQQNQGTKLEQIKEGTRCDDAVMIAFLSVGYAGVALLGSSNVVVV